MGDDMKRQGTWRAGLLWAVWAVWAAAMGLRAGEGVHGHPVPTAVNAAPRPADFLHLDPDRPKTVRLTLVAAYNAVNYGMNFNGFAKGRATYVVPLGWRVEVTFTNASPVPHSVLVVEAPTVRRLQMGDPVFEGASTPDPVRGTTGREGVRFAFTASEAGDFALACGFPSHAANGHWIRLEVSDTATGPYLQFGDDPPWRP